MCADSPAPYASGPRPIDHLVVATRDLDGLAAFYRDLGFTVGARNRHPWGTENQLVQFAGAFIELIGIAPGATIPKPPPTDFGFGRFISDYLGKREGMALLGLASEDAKGDARAFKAAGMKDFPPFFFERMGKNAAGDSVRVAFTLAFAQVAGTPGAGFFTCQQHEPQNFWNPAAQVHANGVTGIVAAVMVASDPADWHEFLGPFIGQRTMRSTSTGLEIDTGRGLVEVLSPEGFRFKFGTNAPDVSTGPLFAGVTLRCANSSTVAEILKGRGVATAPFGRGGIRLAAPHGGLALAFVTGDAP